MGAGAAESGLPAHRVEVLFLEKGNDPPGRQMVAPGLDAGGFEVSQEVGVQIVRIGRWRGEGFGLTDARRTDQNH